MAADPQIAGKMRRYLHGHAMFFQAVPGRARSGGVSYVDTDFFHVRSPEAPCGKYPRFT